MKIFSTYFFKEVICFFLLFLSQQIIHAQNLGVPDTSFGLGTFNGLVMDIKVQTDGKIIVVGNFTKYKSTTVGRIVRLNSDGSLDNSFSAGTGANSMINTVAIQSDGKILAGGNFDRFNGDAKLYIIRLNADGSTDNTFIGLANGVYTGYVMSITIQTDNKILVGGSFTLFNGVSTNRLVRLNIDGSIDNTFIIGSGANNGINSVALQTDGKILIAGYFTSFNGVSKKGLIRLNTGGAIDTTFNIGSGPGSGYIEHIALQSDDKILIGGNFNGLNGSSLNYFTRLNTDGSVDNTFNTGTGINGRVRSIGVRPDGKILIGGEFTIFNGLSKKYIVSINSDGSADAIIDTGTGANSFVNSIVIKTDGKVLIGGEFSNFNGGVKNRICLLAADGTLDLSFNAGQGTCADVNSIAVQADGKILAGGAFQLFNNVSTNYLVRLNFDGTIDNTFNIGTGANDIVNSIIIQPDGKIVAAGAFTSFNGTTKNHIVRLNQDGSLDNTFNIGTGTDHEIKTLLLQEDKKILAGGYFTSYNGLSQNSLVRINENGSADNSFNIGSGTDSIFSIAMEPDGQILAGGAFTTFNGLNKKQLVRLNTDGSIDNTFNAGSGADGSIYSLAVQEDGRIIVGGLFNHFNGASKECIVRLLPEGAIDKTFNVLNGAWYRVDCILLTSDNKILIGGDLRIVGGIEHDLISRLNLDGSIDTAFISYVNTSSIAIAASYIKSIAIQNDGKIVAGGSIFGYNGVTYNNIFRLGGDNPYYNTLRGVIYTDANKDCNPQPSENRLSTIIVKALPGPFYGMSDANGKYILRVDTGNINYTISQTNNYIGSQYLKSQCASSHQVTLNGSFKDTCCFNFADSIQQCRLMNIEIVSSRMRRCFKSSTNVNYCNYGNTSATGTQVKVVYPSYVVPISSVPMWTSKNDSILLYDLGTLDPTSCGNISIIDSVICGDPSIRGLTQCIKAFISPVSNCVLENPAWDKSSMTVIGICKNGNVEFTISNNGLGNMANSQQYRVYLNDTLIYTGNYKLKIGENFLVTYPAGGQTIRVEADQHPNHPGLSRPRAIIENCGTSILPVRGLVTTAPQDDLDEEVAISCDIIVDSYDPNDKKASPEGFFSENKIAAGTELEYTIRFQNTGTDTAYQVIVVDTLDIALEPTSFIKGASSHPYTLKVSGKNRAILSFNFFNINLPDSTKNKLGSNGYVSFKINIASATSSGTQIKNKAHIFFDYNSAIVTNETMHTVDNNIDIDLSKGTSVQVFLLPTASTGTVSGITTASATVGAEILDPGSPSLTLRGICWNSSPNPTISDFKTTEGNGTGTYASVLSPLTENTTYYVRAYAINSFGTAYGNEVSFKTPISTGINNSMLSNSISIYPNPTTGQFKIEFKSFDASVFGLEIINAQGKLIYKEEINQYLGDYTKEIDMKNFINGIYCLQILTEKGTIIRKVIIQ